MKQVLISSLFFMMLCCPLSVTAQVESGYYAFYAAYDGHGKDLTRVSSETQLFIFVWDDIEGTYMSASENFKIGGVELSRSLSTINAPFCYVGVQEGWYVFKQSKYMSIKVNGNVARVEQYGYNGQYLGYKEFRK